MAKHITLPHDPRTGLLDIGALLAFNRALYGDARMDGEGGDGGGGTGGDGGGGAGDGGSGGSGGSGGDGGSGAGDKGSGEHGFPANTPLEQMNADQREAYWKFQARKHEDRVKSYGGLTPDQIKALQDKAKKHDDLERELMSDKDKAVAEAKEATERETKDKFAPKLVRAEFRAALKGRVDDEHLDERLSTITDPLDLSKFLNDAGDVDTDKVAKFVDGIAPVTGGSNGRRGPTATGHGSGSGSGNSRSGSDSSALTGREMYEQRHKKKTTTTA